MPVGRIYQAPTVTIPRHTPVYGLHGIKSSININNINNGDILFVKGKGVNKKSDRTLSPDKNVKSGSPQRPYNAPSPQRNLNSPQVRRSKSPSPRPIQVSRTGDSSKLVREIYKQTKLTIKITINIVRNFWVTL